MIKDDKHICPSCNKKYGSRKNKRCPHCGCPLFYDNEVIGYSDVLNRYGWFFTVGEFGGQWHRVCSLNLFEFKSIGDR